MNAFVSLTSLNRVPQEAESQPNYLNMSRNFYLQHFELFVHNLGKLAPLHSLNVLPLNGQVGKGKEPRAGMSDIMLEHLASPVPRVVSNMLLKDFFFQNY